MTWRAKTARVLLRGLRRQLRSSAGSVAGIAEASGADDEQAYKARIEAAFADAGKQLKLLGTEQSIIGPYFIGTNLRLNVRIQIQTRLPNAWYEGFRRAGLERDELTVEEMAALTDGVAREYGYADDLAGWAQGIANRVEAGEMTVEAGAMQYANRAALWQLAWDRARNQAIEMAHTNPKLVWVYGDTVHCHDCLRYNGRVYRAATWARYDIRPQHPSLACHGFRCRCRLLRTSDPLTPGKPPAMSG